MKTSNSNKTFINSVAKDIINIKIKQTDTLNSLNAKFYAIMRKYGIKRGTKVGNAIQGSNFEWTMCQELFHNRIRDFLEFDQLFKEIPKDLQY